MNTSEKRSRLTSGRFKRNKTMKAIKISLLTLAAIVVLYAGPAFAWRDGEGYVHHLWTNTHGEVMFKVKDGDGKWLFRKVTMPNVLDENDDAKICSSSGKWIALHHKITPASRAYQFKMLSIAQVTKSRMKFRVKCGEYDVTDSKGATTTVRRAFLYFIRYD